MANVKGNSRGFTLIELVVVIVIVGILASVSVPVYRGYTRRAMATEGRTLMNAVGAAQKIHYLEKGAYQTVSVADSGKGTDAIPVPAEANKYFKSYTVSVDGTKFTATTTGDGQAAQITITLVGEPNKLFELTETGTN